MADSNPQKPVSKAQEQIRQLAAWLPALTVVIFLGYAALAWFLLLVPKIGPLMPGGKYDYSSLEQRIQDDQAYIEKVKAALSGYQAIPALDRQRVKYVVPESQGLPSLMGQLEGLADVNGMSLTVIDFSVPEAEATSAGRLPIEIAVSFNGGSYADFKSLLDDIERSIRLLDIQKVVFSPKAESFQMTLRTYYLASGA